MEAQLISGFMHGVATMFIMAASFFFLYKKKLRLQKVTGYILLFWLFLMLKDLFFYPYFPTTVYWQTIGYHLDMCAVPCCAFFLNELARPGFVNFRIILFSELPYLLAGLLFVLTGNPATLLVIGVYSFVYGVAIVIWSAWFLKRYKQIIKANYSNIDYLDVAWLWKAIGTFFFFLLYWLITCFYNIVWLDATYYAWTCIFWGVICYYTHRQEVPSEEDCASVVETNSSASVNSASVTFYPFVAELERQLTKEHVYMNPQLAIADLSLLIGTNRTYLSAYLNNCLHITFYDYINGYRLNEAIKHLTSSKEEWISIEEIAVKCGFNSLSTFRRAFQKVHGCTPNEYRKAH